MDIEKIARVYHEANRGWCEANGDHSQRIWEDAEAWQREASVDGVKFALEHPDASDSAHHDFWMKLKLSQGWRYGPVKDATAKTHPWLIPFDQLPFEQQAKDRLLRAIVKALS
jgi:RyR domain